MQLYNQTRGSLVAKELEIPHSALSRMKGLLGRTSLPEGHAMLLTDCRWVHTFGMQFAIDLLFLDKNHRIVAIRHSMRPNRLSPFVWRAVTTVELPADTIRQSQIAVGDQLEISSRSVA